MAEVMLPYRTEGRAMIALLDYAKGKGVDRATLEARMGSGESLRETLNAVEQLGLATRDESGNIHLTESGERLAYAVGDADRSAELSRAMLSYPPYAIPLDRAVAEGLSVLDAAWVERIWQVDMRLAQPRNRVEEARTFYFRLADEGGLGVYRRGVRGQPTRLELVPDLAAVLQRLRDEAPVPEPVAPVPVASAAPSNAPPMASLQITVDMTDWEIEKIEAFLRLLGIASPARPG